MRRLPRTHKKLAMAKSEEPDFFELAKTSPLPTLEQARMNLESRKFMRLREHLEKETIPPRGMSDRTRSPLANNASNDTSALEQTKRQNLKHIGSWRHEQGNLTGTSQSAFQSRHQQLKKDAVNQFGLGINRGATTQTAIKLPESLFRLQQQQQDDLQQQQQQQQARAVQQHAEAVLMRQQQEHELLTRHHRAQQMVQQMGQQQQQQQQYLQDVRQADLAQQQQNQINLLRQMEFLQNQRSGF